MLKRIRPLQEGLVSGAMKMGGRMMFGRQLKAVEGLKKTASLVTATAKGKSKLRRNPNSQYALSSNQMMQSTDAAYANLMEGHIFDKTEAFLNKGVGYLKGLKHGFTTGLGIGGVIGRGVETTLGGFPVKKRHILAALSATALGAGAAGVGAGALGTAGIYGAYRLGKHGVKKLLNYADKHREASRRKKMLAIKYAANPSVRESWFRPKKPDYAGAAMSGLRTAGKGALAGAALYHVAKDTYDKQQENPDYIGSIKRKAKKQLNQIANGTYHLRK